MTIMKPSYPFVLLFLISALTTGCMTVDYQPSMYQFPEGRIPNFAVNGEVELQNVQPSKEQQKSSASGHKFIYDYNRITDAFNRQFQNEVKKSGKATGNLGKKTLKTFISELECGVKGLNTWIYRCHIKGWMESAEGTKFTIDSKHGSPVNLPPTKALDDMIAIGVEDLLKSDVMQAYLKQ